jgi:hypothetical protein
MEFPCDQSAADSERAAGAPSAYAPSPLAGEGMTVEQRTMMGEGVTS